MGEPAGLLRGSSEEEGEVQEGARLSEEGGRKTWKEGVRGECSVTRSGGGSAEGKGRDSEGKTRGSLPVKG